MSLKAWYKLDSNLNDSSGNSYTGTNYSSTYEAGKISNCIVTNGSSTYFTTPTILPATKNNFTVSFWIYPISSNSGTLYIACPQSSGIDHAILYDSSNKKINIEICEASDTNDRVKYTTNDTVPINTWIHIAISIQNLVIKYYINGFLNTTFTETIPIAPWTGIWSWGQRGNSTYYLNAKYDDIRIYDNILSDTEIKELSKAKILHYQFNSPLEEPTTNLTSNPSLETGLNGYTYWNNSGTSSLTLVSSQSYDGVYSGEGIKLTDGSTGFNLGQKVLTASTIYTLSFYIKVTALGTSENGSVPYWRESHTGNTNGDNYGNFTYEDGTAVTWANLLAKNDWVRIFKTATTAADHLSTYICFYLNKSGSTVYFDAIQFEQKDHLTPFVNGTRSGIVQDISGYENNGTIGATTSPAYSTFSKLGTGAFNFTPVQTAELQTYQYISASNTYISALTQFTYSTWVKTTDSTAFLIMGIPQSTNSYESLGIVSGKLVLHKYGYNSNSDINIAASTTSVNDDIWHLLTITYDAGLTKTYVDGILENTGTHVNSAYSNIVFQINYASANLPDPYYLRNYSGYLDDVRVYATALSDNDILELYKTKAQLDKSGNLFVNEIQNNGLSNTASVKFLRTLFEDNNNISNGSKLLDTNGDGIADTFTGDSYVSYSLENNKQYSTTTAGDGNYYNSTYCTVGTHTINYKYYTRFDYDVANNTYPGTIFIMLNYGAGNVVELTTSTINNTHGSISTVYTADATGETLWKIYNAISSSYTLPIGHKWGFGNAYHINLTGIFGTGLEPTQAQMDAWYAEYKQFKFENEGILNAKEINEVGSTANLLAYYPMNNLLDYSGNLYDITNSGAVSYPEFGKFKSYYFNGSSNYMTIPWGQNINPYTQDLTFTLWLNSANTGINTMFISTGQLPAGDYRFYISTYGGVWDMGIQTSTWGTGTIPVTSGWHFVVITMNSGTATMMVDNSVVIVKSYTSYTFNQNVKIGSHDSNYYFNGQISDFRIYTRVLTQTELDILYRMKTTPMQVIDGEVYIAGEFRND